MSDFSGTFSATPRDWFQAARPHTWANAFSPVIVGCMAVVSSCREMLG